MGSGGPEDRKLRPTALVEFALGHSVEQFTRHVRCPLLLLFSLMDDDVELVHGLSSDARDADGLSFRTATHNVDGRPVEGRPTMAPHSLRPRRATSEWAVGERTSERAVADLTNAMCFAVPITKRAEGAFLREVSVGRARNHDIVLRHPSVSKFHATLDLTEAGKLSVLDRNSRNGTWINDERIQNRSTLTAGDTVRFGAVSARVGTVEGLYRLIRG